jgi:glycine betaine/proline transport system substrate-binding protein
MKTTLRALSIAGALAVGLATVIGLPQTSRADVPESQDPIKIALFDWTSVNVNAKIMGGILHRLGYNVDYVTADYLSSLTTGLTTGDIDIITEEWDTTAGDAMKASDATGQTERLGKLGPKAKEDWWYPIYMKEKCPGLPDWHALLDPKCAEAFSTADTAPKGRYLGGPVTWGGYDEERIAALKLPFEVVHAGTDAAMFAELASAYERKAPIMLWIYSPHWAPAKYEGEWVNFPDFTADCYDKKLYTCGKPHGEIWKYGWKGLKDKWPVAWNVAKNFTMDTKELGLLAGQVDLDGKKLEDVADAWINANEAKWRAWANPPTN